VVSSISESPESKLGDLGSPQGRTRDPGRTRRERLPERAKSLPERAGTVNKPNLN
jgi:hypothetical protein